MSLQDLINENKILKFENISIEEIKTMFGKAIRFFNDAKWSLRHGGDDLVNYTKVYDAIRIAGEALLLLNGYRARKGTGYHQIIIKAVSELINGELKIVLKRIKRMRSKRNQIEYGASDVSKDELINAIKDVQQLLSKIEELIKKQDPQKALI